MTTVGQVPVRKTEAPASRAMHPTIGLFGSLQREIDRLFDDFTPAFAGARAAGEVKCRMDLAETSNGLELAVEVPGLEEKDVDVSISDGMLTVSGEKKFEKEQKDKSYRFIERGYGAFSRSIQLPPGVKAENIKAELSKGVLKVSIPTPDKPKATKVKIASTS